jgi:hypothetical protein
MRLRVAAALLAERTVAMLTKLVQALNVSSLHVQRIP